MIHLSCYRFLFLLASLNFAMQVALFVPAWAGGLAFKGRFFTES